MGEADDEDEGEVNVDGVVDEDEGKGVSAEASVVSEVVVVVAAAVDVVPLAHVVATVETTAARKSLLI